MRLRLIPGFTCALLLVLFGQSSAQWPALYFRADPLLRLDLSRPNGGSSFGLAVYSYSAEAYFDGLDRTPHTSRAEMPMVRFQREEYVFSGSIGLSRNTALVVSLPVSYVRQRLFETGDWGVEKVWLGGVHALDAAHHVSLLMAAAIPVDGAVGNLHFPVGARDHSGFLTTQLIYAHNPDGLSPHVYLRVGAGVHTSKEEYYGRRLYEFPAEFHATLPVGSSLRVGGGAEGRFVVGSPDDRIFVRTLSSHDAFAFGPDLVIHLTQQASLRATYRQEAIGYYATAGSYWNVAMILGPHGMRPR